MGQTLKSSIGDINITATPFLSKMQDDEVTITVKRIEPMSMVEFIKKKRLSIVVGSRDASIIDIKYKDVLERAGMIVSGISPDGKLPEIIEIPSHRFFVAGQFHPEFQSNPFAGHPMFNAFIAAAKKK